MILAWASWADEILSHGPIIAWACIGLVVGTPATYFWLRRAAPRRLEKIGQEIAVTPARTQRLVTVRFTTYWGLLAFFVQQTHEVTLPADLAELWLNRLLRFNLTYGVPAAGTVFILILSLRDYRAQLRIVRAALREPLQIVPDEAHRGKIQPG